MWCNPNDRESSSLRNERGAALIVVFLLVLVVSLTVMALTSEVYTETQFVERERNLTRGLYAAESGVSMAENILWNQYVTAQGGSAGLMPSYVAYLNSLNIPNDPNAETPLAALAGVSLDGRSNVNNVTVTREDSLTQESTDLTLTAVGTDRFGNPQTVVERLRVQAGATNTTKFGVLAKDLACIFCHTEVDSAQRVYNKDPGLYGSFERVRVGALDVSIIQEEDLSNGQQSYDSRIAGTLYTRGPIINRDNGSPMTSGEVNASSLDGYAFDPNTGYITEDPNTGAVTQVNLSQAQKNQQIYEPGANLYLEYPSDPTEQTDGPLPDSIPPVFSDLDNDRLVDSNEVLAKWQDAQGAYGVKAPGTISGGSIQAVPLGTTIVNALTMSDVDGTTGVYQGNLVLSGTSADPLLVDKTVVVEGDVIISGVVKGTGQIYASGNIYVVGDLTYADGTDGNGDRTYGLAGDGTQNLLMLNAGGNVLINDYLTPEYQNAAAADDPTYIDFGDHMDPVVNGLNATNPDYNSGFSFTMQQMAYYNRAEWQKTQPELMNSSGHMVTNDTYDPTYIPQYLTMGPNDPVYIYGMRYKDGSGTWQGTYWDKNDLMWQGESRPEGYNVWEDKNHNGNLDPGEDIDGDGQLDVGELIRLTPAEAAAQNAAIVHVSPNDGWISDTQLKQLWITEHASHQAGAPLTVEAGVKTSSAIFMLARNNTRYGRSYYGQALINGSLTANNLGLLAPADFAAGVTTGMQLHYDPRLTVFNDDSNQFAVQVERLALEYH